MAAPFRDKSDIRPLPVIPQALTDALQGLERQLNALRSPLAQLNAIYEYLDRYNRFVSTFAVCSKGCSHCCKIDVAITEVEAEFIAQKVKQPAASGMSITHGHTTSCPFLSTDGTCSVYKARPFHCRTFHTLDDPKYCASGEAHQIYGSHEGSYSSDVYRALAFALHQINDGRPIRDIRDFFPLHRGQ